jgi:hypothetical protein
MYIFLSKLVYFLLSLTCPGINKRISLLRICTLRIRDILIVQDPGLPYNSLNYQFKRVCSEETYYIVVFIINIKDSVVRDLTFFVELSGLERFRTIFQIFLETN